LQKHTGVTDQKYRIEQRILDCNLQWT